MKKIVLAAAAATAALFSTTASAEITWTHSAGGFVGKGDVQVPLGWDNKTLQANANSISFSYHEKRSYDVLCFQMREETVEVDELNPRGKIVTKKIKVPVRVEDDFARTDNIQANVTYDARTNKQVTGFRLVGVTIAAPTPRCPGGWELDTVDDFGNAQDPLQNLVRDNGKLTANGTDLPTYLPSYSPSNVSY